MKTYISNMKNIYSQIGSKMILFCFLSVISGLTSGIGILMIFPLLYIAGLFSGNYESNIFFNMLTNLLPRISGHLGLFFLLITYITILLVKALLDRVVSILIIHIISDYKEKITVTYFTSLMKTEWTYYISKNKSEFMNTLFNDIDNVKNGIFTQLSMISNAILAIIQILLSLLISWKATILILLIGGVCFLFVSPYIKKMQNIGDGQRKNYKDLIDEIRQQMEGLKDIKCYGLQEESVASFKKCTSSIKNIMIEYNTVGSKPSLIYKIIASIVISTFIYYCIAIANIDAPSLITIILIFSRLWPLYSSFQNDIQAYIITIPSYKSLTTQMEEFATYKRDDCNDHKQIEMKRGIEFKNIDFRYPQNEDKFVLEKISFYIPKNKITAIVGKSGSGKTTIADILVGLFTPVNGEILIDDNPLNGEFLNSWQRQIAYVQQDSFLFGCSIRNNLLRYWPEASDEDIHKAIGNACAEFIYSLPNGIDTIVGDRGVTLSGGERQRIILARALIRNPKLLILDEATSSLDNESEYRIQKIIENLSKNITVLLIAHRLSTVKRADIVIVLNNGHIIERGSYEELTTTNNGYLYEMIEISNAV